MLLETYVDDSTGLQRGQDLEELRNEGQQIDNAVGPGHEDHGRERTGRQSLLKGNVLIYGDKRITKLLDPIKQRPVVNRRQAAITYCLHLVASQVWNERAWDAVVE